MVVVTQGKIVGMIDIKENCHICLFFVDSSYQRRGVGRVLLDHALAHCLRNTSKVTVIDVHSSLFAVPIYKKLGFRQTKPEQIRNEIRFVEMVKQI
jgi:GNAT superfamily N-acetyltransferase